MLTSQIKIETYNPLHDKDFAHLNYEWLNNHFEVEEHDVEMLDHPHEYIIKPGGQIFFAYFKGKVVGTAALIVENETTYELAKMAVAPEYRGLKIGNLLMEACLDYCKENGVQKIVLESSTKLPPALNLYIKYGFRVIPLNPNTLYSRANIRMQLNL